MRILVCRALVWTLIGLSAPVSEPATAPSQPTYSIRLSTDRAGQKWLTSISVGYKRTRKTWRDGTLRNDASEQYLLDLDGEMEVLTAKNGEATTVRLLIDRLQKTQGIDRTPLLSAGSRVIIDANGARETKYTMEGGGEIPPEALRALRSVVDVQREGLPSTEQIFGAPEPQPVGGTWKINSAQFAKALAAVRLFAKPGTFDGRMRLAAIETRDGKEMARIEGELSNDVTVEVGSGWKLTNGRVQESLAMLRALDPGDVTAESSSAYEMSLSFLRYTGARDEHRETSVDNIVQLREVKNRAAPATRPS